MIIKRENGPYKPTNMIYKQFLTYVNGLFSETLHKLNLCMLEHTLYCTILLAHKNFKNNYIKE